MKIVHSKYQQRASVLRSCAFLLLLYTDRISNRFDLVATIASHTHTHTNTHARIMWIKDRKKDSKAEKNPSQDCESRIEIERNLIKLNHDKWRKKKRK